VGRGAWKWYQVDLDPWETADSLYYGASLAALSVGMAPAEYRHRPHVRPNIDRLVQYLQEGMPRQPLHNRVALLWASSKLPELLSASTRQALIEEIFRGQAADGGWAIQSLGPGRRMPLRPSRMAARATRRVSSRTCCSRPPRHRAMIVDCSARSSGCARVRIRSLARGRRSP
jgi:hypothetical protein